MSYFARLFCIGLFSLSTALAAASSPTADPVELLDQALDDTRTFIVGELHGTQETPALVANLAQRWAKHGPVLVALEIPAQEQPRLQAYFRSPGADADRQHLLAGEFWQKPRERSDGRRSEAMLGLLESLRAFVAAGAPVEVLAFDDEAFHGAGRDRNAQMAERLRQAMIAQPERRILVLTGNYHARWTLPERINSQSVPEGFVPPRPMAAALRGPDVANVNVTAERPQFWACMQQQACGPLTPLSMGSAGAEMLVRSTATDRDYDLVLTLPALHVSEPVRVNSAD